MTRGHTAMKACCAKPAYEESDSEVSERSGAQETVFETGMYKFVGQMVGGTPASGTVEFKDDRRFLMFVGNIESIEPLQLFSGHGTLTVKENEKEIELSGEIVCGQLEGAGRKRVRGERDESGVFKGSELCGDNCVSETLDRVIRGQFANGAPHGLATLTNKTTGQEETGYFENGVLKKRLSTTRKTRRTVFESGPNEKGMYTGIISEDGIQLKGDFDSHGNLLAGRDQGQHANGIDEEESFALEIQIADLRQIKKAVKTDQADAQHDIDHELAIFAINLPSV